MSLVVGHGAARGAAKFRAGHVDARLADGTAAAFGHDDAAERRGAADRCRLCVWIARLSGAAAAAAALSLAALALPGAAATLLALALRLAAARLTGALRALRGDHCQCAAGHPHRDRQGREPA